MFECKRQNYWDTLDFYYHSNLDPQQYLLLHSPQCCFYFVLQSSAATSLAKVSIKLVNAETCFSYILETYFKKMNMFNEQWNIYELGKKMRRGDRTTNNEEQDVLIQTTGENEQDNSNSSTRNILIWLQLTGVIDKSFRFDNFVYWPSVLLNVCFFVTFFTCFRCLLW